MDHLKNLSACVSNSSTDYGLYLNKHQPLVINSTDLLSFEITYLLPFKVKYSFIFVTVALPCQGLC